MRAYQLPSGQWVDLDHIQSIGLLEEYEHHLSCWVRFAFQEKEVELELDDSTNPRNRFNPSSSKLSRYDAKINRQYKKLIDTWRTL